MDGKTEFEKHVTSWSAALGVPCDSDTLEATVARAQQEILYDAESGIVPRTVKSFAELHDYVDANGYGDAFSWPESPSETNDPSYVVAWMEFWNEVHGRIHDWIAQGQMLDDLNSRDRNGSVFTRIGDRL